LAFWSAKAMGASGAAAKPEETAAMARPNASQHRRALHRFWTGRQGEKGVVIGTLRAEFGVSICLKSGVEHDISHRRAPGARRIAWRDDVLNAVECGAARGRFPAGAVVTARGGGVIECLP
jgi:hypothetical protein